MVKLEQKSLTGNLKCWFQVRIIRHQRFHKHMIAHEVGNAIGEVVDLVLGHDINSAGWEFFANRSGERAERANKPIFFPFSLPILF